APLLDKTVLAERAAAVGLPTPPSRVFDSARELLLAADGLEYPLVLKAPVSRWAPFRADGPNDLRAMDGREGRVVVQPFLTEPVHAVSGLLWRGELIASLHQRYLRTWPVDCGTASAAVTVEPDPEL